MPQIDDLLKRMVDLKASDVHMTSGQVPMLRVHGDMRPFHEVTEVPRTTIVRRRREAGEKFVDMKDLLSAEKMDELIREIIPERNLKEFEEINDSDFAYEIPHLGRFRVNAFRDRSGSGLVIRHIPTKIQTLEELGMPDPVKQFCFLTKGLVVVTGPTGSGKSTTLAAMVDMINRTRKEHIITIEDPIEFVHVNKSCLVNQREVGVHTKGFARALRAALREDPDIVLLGEMRDLETIATAIETAETGHLVFGTLHTNTAISTVDRIVDQFPADRQNQVRAMLASSLKGVVAQTLCKRVDGKGRVAAMEVLTVNYAVSSLIREARTTQITNIMQTGKRQGMLLMTDSLQDFVQRKVITPEDAYLKAFDKEDMMRRFQQMGISFNPAKLGA